MRIGKSVSRYAGKIFKPTSLDFCRLVFARELDMDINIYMYKVQIALSCLRGYAFQLGN